MSQSLLNRYTAMEKEAESLKNRLASMQDDPRLQREFEFKDKLTELMEDFDKSASDVLKLIQPEDSGASGNLQKRAKRKLKVYEHPGTGRVIETRGGNHKELKSWKNEHGSEAVESWLVSTHE